ncbi:putative fimbrial chaperone protein ElfD precursor [compost metagenome]
MFLVRSWVADADGKKVSDFIVTPPLFVLNPQKESSLRVMFVGTQDPTIQQERVYYFHSQAIPSLPEEAKGKNTLQIATKSVIKLFLRPTGLPFAAIDAPASLRCKKNSSSLIITNPSSYYVTMIELMVGGKKFNTVMVPPKSDTTIPAHGATGEVKFKTINDFGAHTPQQTCVIQ